MATESLFVQTHLAMQVFITTSFCAKLDSTNAELTLNCLPVSPISLFLNIEMAVSHVCYCCPETLAICQNDDGF